MTAPEDRPDDAKRWQGLWEKAAVVELQAENEQLRDALADREQELARVEARLEAVAALCEIPDWPPQGVDINGRAMPKFVSTDAILAALSVAPQPQPPASDEPSQVDLVSALRASLEAAKNRRFGPGSS